MLCVDDVRENRGLASSERENQVDAPQSEEELRRLRKGDDLGVSDRIMSKCSISVSFSLNLYIMSNIMNYHSAIRFACRG